MKTYETMTDEQQEALEATRTDCELDAIFAWRRALVLRKRLPRRAGQPRERHARAELASLAVETDNAAVRRLCVDALAPATQSGAPCIILPLHHKATDDVAANRIARVPRAVRVAHHAG